MNIQTSFLFLLSLSTTIYSQQYTFSYDENVVFKQFLTYSDVNPTETYDFQIKDCPQSLYPGESLTGYKIQQTFSQSSVIYNTANFAFIQFEVAEICIKGAYVHTEEIIVDPNKFKDTFIFKSKPPQYKQNMKSIPYIIGFASKIEQNVSLFIESYKPVVDGFEFSFSSACQNCIIRININYLYYEENFSAYFKFDELIESKYKIMKIPALISEQSPHFQIDLPFQCDSDSLNICKIKLGYNGFNFIRENFGYIEKIIPSKKENILKINYDAPKTIVSNTVQVIFFEMIKCNSVINSNNTINHNGQCIEKMP